MEVLKTDIAIVSATAIVLPANSRLKEGSGASRAIYEAAGRNELVDACKKLGECKVGQAVPTPAFNLDARFIIHAVVPKWIDGNNSEYELLCTAYQNSLNLADVMGCETIAFPVLASGNNGFDMELAFEIARQSIEEYEGTNLKKAFLVIYGNRITSIVSERGYSIKEFPDKINKSKGVQKQNGIKEGLAKAFKYLTDPKNIEKAAIVATTICNTAQKVVDTYKKIRPKSK